MAQLASDWFLFPFGGMLSCRNYVLVSIEKGYVRGQCPVQDQDTVTPTNA